jgi:hypothetical protein
VIFTQQSVAYEAVYESGTMGLVGIVAVKVVDNDGATVTAASTAGIIEIDNGVYSAERIAPGPTGQYTVIWSIDGTFDDGTISIEDLIVAASTGAEPLPPLPPLAQVGAPQPGPCSAWTTGTEVLACCASDLGSDISVFDDVITESSGLLWQFSGRRFDGSCQKTVRPCSTRSICDVQILSRGHIVNWGGSSWLDDGAPYCGCRPLSSVLLPGYPVREIVEVKIDGVVVDPDTYRLDGWRELVRTREFSIDDVNLWPTCQAMDLPDTEPGTFSVTYLFGIDPPQAGRAAAAELACELYKLCSDGNVECALPRGVTRVVRQGVTFERPAFLSWAFDRKLGWRTGLPRVDLFLSAYNPAGIPRRPTFWSPSRRNRYARTIS